MTGQGGRPRDPRIDGRVTDTATHILADQRMPGYTADNICATAGIGKASLYRRWRTLDQLLADIIDQLGVRDIDYQPGPGDTRGDLTALLTAATTGRRALAEAAVLPRIGLDLQLRQAYALGPLARLESAIDACEARASARGERPWPSNAPIAGGVALLLLQVQASGHEPDDADIGQVVDLVVLPGLGLQAVTS